MKQILILFFSFVSIVSYTQTINIDSLKRVYKKNKNFITLKLLTERLINEKSLEESLDYFIELGNTAAKKGDLKTECNAYKYQAETHMHKFNFEKSESIMMHSLAKSKDSISIFLYDINQLGRVYIHFQKYKQAIDVLQEGIGKNNSLENNKIISVIYTNLGIAYGRENDSEKQVNSYLKAIKYANENMSQKNDAIRALSYLYMELGQYEKSEEYAFYVLNDTSIYHQKIFIINSIYHALAINYSRWGKYKKALKYNFKALEYFKTKGNKLYEFDVLNNICGVYTLLEKFDSTIIFANKALVVATELNHNLIINGAILSLSDGLIGIENFKKAHKILKPLLKDTSETLNLQPDMKKQLFSNLANVNYELNFYKKAYYFSNLHSILNTKLLIKQRDSKVTEIETKYQTEKKENKILELNLENKKVVIESQLIAKEKLEQKQKNQIVLFSILVVFILLTVLFGVYRRHVKSKAIQLETDFQKLLLEQSNKLNEGKQIERDRIASELHDGIGSQLNGVFLQLDLLTSDDDLKQSKYVSELQKIGKRIRELSHQMADNGQETEANLPQLISDLCTLNITPNFSIDYYSDDNLNSIQFNKNAIIQIYYIIQEALNNILKHAKATHSEISITKINNQLELTIKDNGKGFGTTQKEGFGLKSIKKRSKSLNGECNFSSDNGLLLKIKFPIKSVTL